IGIAVVNVHLAEGLRCHVATVKEALPVCNGCRHNRHRSAGILPDALAGCRRTVKGRPYVNDTMQRLSRTSQIIAMFARYRRAGIMTGLDLGDARDEETADGETDALAERFVTDPEAMGPPF